MRACFSCLWKSMYHLCQRSPWFLDAGRNSPSYWRLRAWLPCEPKKKYIYIYTSIAIYFICSETCLQCDLWNWIFLCI